MKVSGAPFSGQVDFIRTEMSWPITHMVAPKEKALACTECHSKAGRLAASTASTCRGATACADGPGGLGPRAAHAARSARARDRAHRRGPQEVRGTIMAERIYVFKGFERFCTGRRRR